MKKDLKVEWLPREEIKPYWRNPRKNHEIAVQECIRSIEKFGMRQPISIDKKKVIVTGHVRYKALSRMKWTDIPCVVIDDLSPEEVKAYRIADNAVGGIAAWDLELLASEIREVGSTVDMKDFFQGNVDLDAMIADADNLDLPTESDIEDAKDEHETRFAKNVDGVHESYVGVTCPECGEDFTLSSDELLRLHKFREKGEAPEEAPQIK